MNRKGVIAFFAVLVVAAGLAWLGGYNFDYRSARVATLAIYAILVACAAYVVVTIWSML